MALKLKLHKIDDGVGLTLPEEVLRVLHVGADDTVYLTDGGDGSLYLSAVKPTVDDQIQTAQGLMQQYRNTLAELAK